MCTGVEGVGCENGHLSYQTSMQTEDQHRNILHMLERSIASELDLEKKLSDSKSVIEDLKLKLHHQEKEIYFLEESTETVSGRMFEAENAYELLFGTSKELANRLNTMQFHISAQKCREDDLKSKIEQTLTKLSFLENSPEKMEEESNKAGAEFISLQDRIQELEKQLNESNSQLQSAMESEEASQEEKNALHCELSTLENTIKNLKSDVSRAECRAQNAEIRCMELTQANIELNGELSALKSEKSDKADLLEKKLKESNTQLEHAKAAVDAIVEQQGMLKSTMSDMENMIEDLKGKASKAESRAGSAESKCTLLTDTNLELSEELTFLRGRVESLENLVREANHAKVSTAKDIGIRTKIITDLVRKLALERERLHLQVYAHTHFQKKLQVSHSLLFLYKHLYIVLCALVIQCKMHICFRRILVLVGRCIFFIFLFQIQILASEEFTSKAIILLRTAFCRLCRNHSWTDLYMSLGVFDPLVSRCLYGVEDNVMDCIHVT
jgi:chromosome segregation ATPase